MSVELAILFISGLQLGFTQGVNVVLELDSYYFQLTQLGFQQAGKVINQLENLAVKLRVFFERRKPDRGFRVFFVASLLDHDHLLQPLVKAAENFFQVVDAS